MQKIFLLERKKLVRVVEMFAVEATSEDEALLLADEYHDKEPEEETVTESVHVLGSRAVRYVNHQPVKF